MIENPAIVIESAIRENDAHLARIKKIKKFLSDFFPLSEESFAKLTDDQIGYIDQLLYRFSKMQDSLGMRLIPSVYAFLTNEFKPTPFIDILHHLEKIEILISFDEWQFFRNLRNNLAHDYPESLPQTVSTLNLLNQRMDSFLNIYEKLKQTWISRKADSQKF